MTALKANFVKIKGISAILVENPSWPNPANIFIAPDNEGFSLIDVGCGSDSSRNLLLEGLSYWGLNIKKLHTIILSHAHPDHMGAVGWILEKVRPIVLIHHLEVTSALDPTNLVQTFDIPLAKHCWAPDEPTDSFQEFDLLNFFQKFGCSMSAAEEVHAINEGEVLHLGDLAFEVIHTPGHSPGHISLFERQSSILLAGDLVGPSPAWYTPTSGGVIGYLESLAKLETLETDIILPAHGPIIEDAAGAIKKNQDKLLKRETLLKEALHDGSKSFMDLNKTLIHNPMLHFFPGCGITESHLIKLEMEGVIRREGHSVIPLIL